MCPARLRQARAWPDVMGQADIPQSDRESTTARKGQVRGISRTPANTNMNVTATHEKKRRWWPASPAAMFARPPAPLKLIAGPLAALGLLLSVQASGITAAPTTS